jgi:hypothetical protein
VHALWRWAKNRITVEPSDNPNTQPVRELITFLRTLSGRDHDLGMHAAENIERTLNVLEKQPDRGRALLRIDVGGKGMLDRDWSPEVLVQLERHSDIISKWINLE